MLLKKIVLITDDSPSQWEGETIDNQFVYIRYRFGNLSIEISPSKEAWDDGNSKLVFDIQVGEKYDGKMTTTQMLELSHMELAKNF